MQKDISDLCAPISVSLEPMSGTSRICNMHANLFNIEQQTSFSHSARETHFETVCQGAL
jgi:hypothetical protein